MPSATRQATATRARVIRPALATVAVAVTAVEEGMEAAAPVLGLGGGGDGEGACGVGGGGLSLIGLHWRSGICEILSMPWPQLVHHAEQSLRTDCCVVHLPHPACSAHV